MIPEDLRKPSKSRRNTPGGKTCGRRPQPAGWQVLLLARRAKFCGRGAGPVAWQEGVLAVQPAVSYPNPAGCYAPCITNTPQTHTHTKLHESIFNHHTLQLEDILLLYQTKKIYYCQIYIASLLITIFIGLHLVVDVPTK